MRQDRVWPAITPLFVKNMRKARHERMWPADVHHNHIGIALTLHFTYFPLAIVFTLIFDVSFEYNSSRSALFQIRYAVPQEAASELNRISAKNHAFRSRNL